MASKNSSLAGYMAHVYDTQDNLLAATKVTGYDPKWMEIEIEECPDIKKGDTCRILILSFPSPREYMGTVRQQMEMSAVIALYRGKEKENRKNTRYEVNVPVIIEQIVCPGRACRVSLPLTVQLLNLGRGGVRLSAAKDPLAVGDRIGLCLTEGGNEERLFAEVLNSNTSQSIPNQTEYGCRFITEELMASDA